MPNKVCMRWNYLSIPKPQQLHRWRLEMEKWYLSMLCNGFNNVSMLGLNLIRIGKMRPGAPLAFWVYSFALRFKCHWYCLLGDQLTTHFNKICPKGLIENKSTLIDITAWRRTSDKALQWRHNERDDVSNHQRLDCLLHCSFRRRSKKTSKLRVTGRCKGNSPVIGEFHVPRASNAVKCFHFIMWSRIIKNILFAWSPVNNTFW